MIQGLYSAYSSEGAQLFVWLLFVQNPVGCELFYESRLGNRLCRSFTAISSGIFYHRFYNHAFSSSPNCWLTPPCAPSLLPCLCSPTLQAARPTAVLDLIRSAENFRFPSQQKPPAQDSAASSNGKFSNAVDEHQCSKQKWLIKTFPSGRCVSAKHN